MKFKNGFSLIELMVVASIVGILASLAIPSYMNYVTKSRIAEVIQLLEANEAAIAEHISTNGSVPGPTYAPNLPISRYTSTTSQWVAQWTYEQGWGVAALLDSTKLTIPSSPPQKIYIRPHRANSTTDTLVWTCSTFDSSTFTFLPSACQNLDHNQSEWPVGP